LLLQPDNIKLTSEYYIINLAT